MTCLKNYTLNPNNETIKMKCALVKEKKNSSVNFTVVKNTPRNSCKSPISMIKCVKKKRNYKRIEAEGKEEKNNILSTSW